MAASAWDRTSVAAPKASRENIANKVRWVKILSILILAGTSSSWELVTGQIFVNSMCSFHMTPSEATELK